MSERLLWAHDYDIHVHVCIYLYDIVFHSQLRSLISRNKLK